MAGWSLLYQGSPDYRILHALRLKGAADPSWLQIQSPPPGSRIAWTFSMWVKRLEFGTVQAVLNCWVSGGVQSTLNFDSADRLWLYEYDGAAQVLNATSTAAITDGLWHHLHWVWDSGNAVQADRCRLYIDGGRAGLTVTTNAITAGKQSAMGSGLPVAIGRCPNYVSPPAYANMMIAEPRFVDGQALEPAAFITGTGSSRKPVKYTGGYGVGGVASFLEFKDAAALGADSSGLNHPWTLNNVLSTDRSTDTPTA